MKSNIVFSSVFFFFQSKATLPCCRSRAERTGSFYDAEELEWEKSAVWFELFIQCSRTSRCTCWFERLLWRCFLLNCITLLCKSFLCQNLALFFFFIFFTFFLSLLAEASMPCCNFYSSLRETNLCPLSIFPVCDFLMLSRLLFKLETAATITVTLKQNMLCKSSSSETMCFHPSAVKLYRRLL